MSVMYYVWCVYSPNNIGNGPDVKVFFFSIGIIFSNISVSWLWLNQRKRWLCIGNRQVCIAGIRFCINICSLVTFYIT